MFANLLKSKFFVFVGLLVLLFMSFLLVKEFQKKYRINKEIKSLEQEIASLEASNKDIADLIGYLRSPEYRERQARSLLNLQKPGEFAVALPPLEEETVTGEGQAREERRSNLSKWWEYFFGGR